MDTKYKIYCMDNEPYTISKEELIKSLKRAWNEDYIQDIDKEDNIYIDCDTCAIRI